MRSDQVVEIHQEALIIGAGKQSVGFGAIHIVQSENIPYRFRDLQGICGGERRGIATGIEPRNM
jgi:hypothetical protein